MQISSFFSESILLQIFGSIVGAAVGAQVSMMGISIIKRDYLGLSEGIRATRVENVAARAFSDEPNEEESVGVLGAGNFPVANQVQIVGVSDQNLPVVNAVQIAGVLDPGFEQELDQELRNYLNASEALKVARSEALKVTRRDFTVNLTALCSKIQQFSNENPEIGETYRFMDFVRRVNATYDKSQIFMNAEVNLELPVDQQVANLIDETSKFIGLKKDLASLDSELESLICNEARMKKLRGLFVPALGAVSKSISRFYTPHAETRNLAHCVKKVLTEILAEQDFFENTQELSARLQRIDLQILEITEMLSHENNKKQKEAYEAALIELNGRI